MEIKEMMMWFVIVILSLALVLPVASLSYSARFSQYTQFVANVYPPNSTVIALTYSAKNDSAADWTVTLNGTDYYGHTYLIWYGGNGVSNFSLPTDLTHIQCNTLNSSIYIGYNVTITYSTTALTSGSTLALLGLVPLIYVVFILTIETVAIVVRLREVS